MTNILFTCAGRRNYLINYFKKALKGRGEIFAVDMSLSAPAMVDADIPILVPSIYDDSYISVLKDIIKNHNISAVISLNDLELPIIAEHKNELETTGTKVILSDKEIIDISFDKMKTFNFINKIGLHTPHTFSTLKEVKKAIKKGTLNFPLVVKPRWGSASIGIDFLNTFEELELSYKLQQLKLKKSILNTVSQQDINKAIIIQEKIEGKEYGLDILNDIQGNYVGTFAKEKLSMRSGETDKAVSVIDERFEKLGRDISENLRHIGNLDCDVFVANNKLYVLELNPRFGGGYPFSHEAGANIAAMYIEWINGNKNISHFNNYKAGLAFSKYDKMMNIPNL